MCVRVCVCGDNRKKKEEHACVRVYLCMRLCVSTPFECVCLNVSVCVRVCSAMCICMCGTVDQNRALTVAGLLLTDACLEELTAAWPVNHRAYPLALYSHHPILLTLNLAGCCLCVHASVCVCVVTVGCCSFFSDVCLRYGLSCMGLFQTEINQDKVKQNWCKYC